MKITHILSSSPDYTYFLGRFSRLCISFSYITLSLFILMIWYREIHLFTKIPHLTCIPLLFKWITFYTLVDNSLHDLKFVIEQVCIVRWIRQSITLQNYISFAFFQRSLYQSMFKSCVFMGVILSLGLGIDACVQCLVSCP